MSKPTKNQTRAVRIRLDMSIGFDHMIDSIPITEAMVRRVQEAVANTLARENIGVVELLSSDSTQLRLDMRYRTLPPPGEATDGPDATPVSRMRKTPMKGHGR